MTPEKSFDLVVIGAGPGGYTAALRAAELGMTAACVEKEPTVGGVCLNVGCIPSKALLDSSEMFHLARERFDGLGIRGGEGVEADLARMMERKGRVVDGLVKGLRTLMQSRKVEIVHGTARLVGTGLVEVAPNGEFSGPDRMVLSAKHILLAVGSRPVEIPSLPFDGVRIVSSTEALSFDAVPGRLGVVGGGVIGLELGSVWNRLGSKVTVMEALPGIVSFLDGQAARVLERALTGQGFSFRLKTTVTGATVSCDTVRVGLKSSDGSLDELEFDRLLVAVGRRPATMGLGLEGAGVAVDGAGFIRVDESYRTTLPGVWAVGDAVAGPMLAHKSFAEATAAVEAMAGLQSEVDYNALPWVVYTSPEAAGVGLTEEQAKDRGVVAVSGIYPFSAVGRALCLGETAGFAKVLAHPRSGRILGVHIVGPRASELISEGVAVMKFDGTLDDILGMVHAHPTLSEVLPGAAAAARRNREKFGAGA